MPELDINCTVWLLTGCQNTGSTLGFKIHLAADEKKWCPHTDVSGLIRQLWKEISLFFYLCLSLQVRLFICPVSSHACLLHFHWLSILFPLYSTLFFYSTFFTTLYPYPFGSVPVSPSYCTSKSMETTAELTPFQLVQIICHQMPPRPPCANQFELSTQGKQDSQNTSKSKLVHMLTDGHKAPRTRMKWTMHVLWEKLLFYTSWWLPIVKFPWCITFLYSHSSEKQRPSPFFSSIRVWTCYKVPPVIVSLMNHVPSPTSSSSAHINLLRSWTEKIPSCNSPTLFLKYWICLAGDIGIETK